MKKPRQSKKQAKKAVSKAEEAVPKLVPIQDFASSKLKKQTKQFLNSISAVKPQGAQQLLLSNTKEKRLAVLSSEGTAIAALISALEQPAKAKTLLLCPLKSQAAVLSQTLENSTDSVQIDTLVQLKFKQLLSKEHLSSFSHVILHKLDQMEENNQSDEISTLSGLLDKQTLLVTASKEPTTISMFKAVNIVSDLNEKAKGISRITLPAGKKLDFLFSYLTKALNNKVGVVFNCKTEVDLFLGLFTNFGLSVQTKPSKDTKICFSTGFTKAQLNNLDSVLFYDVPEPKVVAKLGEISTFVISAEEEIKAALFSSDSVLVKDISVQPSRLVKITDKAIKHVTKDWHFYDLSKFAYKNYMMVYF